MLQKSHITNIEIFSPEWFTFRLGRFTSSNIYSLIGSGKGAYSYIYSKVGEHLSGISIAQEFDTDGMRHGNAYEIDALKKFGQHMKVEFMVTQALIGDKDSQFSCTPDGLIVRNQSTDELCYNVSTIEVKCPLTYNAFVWIALCNTPEELKQYSSQYYWQVVDQMDVCDALVGYFVCYHPNFKDGKMGIIEFRKINLMDDFKLLKQKKAWALQEFQSAKDKLVAKLLS